MGLNATMKKKGRAIIAAFSSKSGTFLGDLHMATKSPAAAKRIVKANFGARIVEEAKPAKRKSAARKLKGIKGGRKKGAQRTKGRKPRLKALPGGRKTKARKKRAA